MQILKGEPAQDRPSRKRVATREEKFRPLDSLLPLMLACLLCVAWLPAPSEQNTSKEYAVKAAFLYNFTKFVEWPEHAFSKDSPVVIGVLGADPFGEELDQTVRGKAVGNREVAIARFKDVTAAASCHILFISSSEDQKLGEIFKHLDGKSVLTVGESEEFVKGGGMIHFFIEENKVRFEINVSVAERANLKISSKLLRLGRVRK